MEYRMGSLVISLDTELAWGRLMSEDLMSFVPYYLETKDVIFKLSYLFEKYSIPATWAFVGGMLASKSSIIDAHEFLHPKIRRSLTHLLTNNLYDRIIDGRDVFDAILNASLSINHEIASHSFSHITYDHDYEFIIHDLELAKTFFAEYNLNPVTFIHPRNIITKLDLLSQYGYRVYRPAKVINTFQGKFINKFNYFMGLNSESDYSNPTYFSDLVGIQSSTFFARPINKYLPMKMLKKRVIDGLNYISKSDKIYHIWFHPFNFSNHKSSHFDLFEEVLKHAFFLREKGLIQIKTLNQFC